MAKGASHPWQPPDLHSRSVIFYMDGACEPASGQGAPKCSFGGIVLVGDEKFSFGEVLPDKLASQWLARAGKEQMVLECELLPYLVGLSLLPQVFEGRDALVFIDNEAARKTFVKAFTRSDEGALILDSVLPLEEDLDVRSYFCRVPTSSNPADGPSRGDFSLAEKLGCQRIRVSDRWLATALNLAP